MALAADDAGRAPATASLGARAACIVSRGRAPKRSSRYGSPRMW
jgi:hypothetical protein